MFMMVPLVIYFYILKTEKNRILNRYVFIYGAVAAILCNTHYFGLLIVASLFLCDLVLLVLRKLNGLHMLSYVLAAAVFLPFYIQSYMVVAQKSLAFWADPPDIQSLILLTKDIVSDYNSIYLLFLFGMVISVIMVFSPYTRDYLGINRKQVFSSFGLVFTIFFVIGAVFVYSTVINPKGSLFVFRYFIVVLPLILIVAAIGSDSILTILFKNKPAKLAYTTICAIVCVAALYLGVNTLDNISANANTVNEPFEQAMDWIYGQDIAHEPDTLIMSDAPEAGVLYYLTHNGQRPPLNVSYYRRAASSLSEDNYSQWNTIIRFDGHKPPSSSILNVLKEHYTLIEDHDMWGSPILIYQKN